MLRDRHWDKHEDSEIVIRDFAYRRFSVALAIYKSGEVIRPFSVCGLERKIYFPGYAEIVAHFVVLPQKIGIR
ncbi:MAG TPA: hypothetical protein VMT67_13910 [Terriglobales bacterium]|nr:hypothetical protein [Terriglobales bacterium]